MWHGGCPRGPPEAMVTVVCGPAWCGGHWGPLIVVVPVHKYKKSFSKREKRQQKEEKKYITCQWGSFWAPFDLVVQVVLVTVHRHRSGSRRHASQTHLSCVNQWTKFRPMVARLLCCVGRSSWSCILHVDVMHVMGDDVSKGERIFRSE
jgi:hypothetical protein